MDGGPNSACSKGGTSIYIGKDYSFWFTYIAWNHSGFPYFIAVRIIVHTDVVIPGDIGPGTSHAVLREEMKMKLKKILLVIIASLLGVHLFAVSPAQSKWTEKELEENLFVLEKSNDKIELYFNEDEAILAIRVIETGYVWYSSPLDWDADERASGFTKNALPSLLSIRAKDMNSTFRPANSYINVVSRGGLKVKEISNGIRLVHKFTKEGITIPLDVTLDGNSILMSVPLNEIKELPDDDPDNKSKLKLLDFEIDPYFGAAESSEDGFILVPDGSGAVIKFNNKRSETVYQQYIYGRDNSVVPTKKKNVSETVSLPIFGLSREGAGFIGVVEGSAARGIINAETAGQMTSYNAVGASCIVRDFDAFTFRERTGTPRDVRIFEKTDLSTLEDVFSVRYIFLDDKENSLAGMANAYRKYLQDNSKFPTEKNDADPALVLNFIGASIKKRPVAGIPMNLDVPFTTFDQARETIESLQELGVTNFVVKYDGWVKGGILGKYPSKATASAQLGGNRELKKLIDFCNEQGIPFYAGGDFVDLYQTDASHINELDVNHAINRSPVKIPDYRMSTFTDEKASDAYPYYILRAPYVADYCKTLMKTFDKKYAAVGIAPDSLGNEVTSDFGTKGTSRVKTVETFRSLLEEYSASHSVLLSRPFDYALAYTSYATDLPMQSSMFDIETETVPFYQMVLKGYIPFSNLPGNRSTTLDDYKLGLLETGADVSYLWIAEHPEYVRDSRMQWFMNVYRDDWLNEAADLYAEVSKVTSLVKGKSITSYTREGTIHTTVFSNGVTVTVNYGDKTYTVTRGKAK